MKTLQTGTDGFTLLEILMVMVIAVSMTAVVISAFNKTPLIGHEVTKMLSLVRQTRAQAIQNQETREIHFQTPLTGFHPDTRIEFKPSFQGNPTLVFYGDGSSSGGIISLTHGDHQRLIGINFMSGAVMVLQ